MVNSIQTRKDRTERKWDTNLIPEKWKSHQTVEGQDHQTEVVADFQGSDLQTGVRIRVLRNKTGSRALYLEQRMIFKIY